MHDGWGDLLAHRPEVPDVVVLYAPGQVERMQARVAAQAPRVVRVVEAKAADVRGNVVPHLLERREDGPPLY